MKFIALEESNGHEGEEWRFWLQIDDNEDAIAGLRKLMDYHDLEDWDDVRFALTTEATEEEVDTLVKFTMQGYMDNENKITGSFDLGKLEARLGENTSDEDKRDELVQALNKGGIEDYFS